MNFNDDAKVIIFYFALYKIHADVFLGNRQQVIANNDTFF